MNRRIVAGLLFGSALMLAGCIPPPPAPIPPPMAEVIPNPPVSSVPLMWQPGHWDWTGNSFVWAPGQYVQSAGHGGTWMPGWWQQTGAGWVWQPAHWV
jgi:hypothetical protein